MINEEILMQCSLPSCFQYIFEDAFDLEHTANSVYTFAKTSRVSRLNLLVDFLVLQHMFVRMSYESS